ncbi:MAG TPA: carboxymuconolactone decarboxylase family protein [Acidimicrobiales bacterium]|nr:carboxymuconolactone decarboxylase family protein [Acidimicrobiales bacterium]
MSTHPSAPRLTPLTLDEMTDDQRELVGAAGQSRPLNIFATLVRAPGLYRRWSTFAGKLLRGGKLPERDRELVILRTALRCAAAYEWGQHISIARDAGLSDEEILRVAEGPSADGWSDHDRALVTAVDELHDAHCLGDATWQALASSYTDQQMIELTFLSGHYAMLAGALNSFGVQPEGPLPGLGEV